MSDKEQFRKGYLNEPKRNPFLSLAIQYHRECEEFDEKVCSGGKFKNGFARPANPKEIGLISNNAKKVYTRLSFGLNLDEQKLFREAIREIA